MNGWMEDYLELVQIKQQVWQEEYEKLTQLHEQVNEILGVAQEDTEEFDTCEERDKALQAVTGEEEKKPVSWVWLLILIAMMVIALIFVFSLGRD